MASDIFYDPQIFTKSYEEALKHNEQTLDKIRSFKKELEDVKINLEQNQNHLYRNIMVPLGSKALIKGKLVHTNEVTINIGDRWFIKKSATGAIQTCNRMIERCNQNLAEYEKEMNLLCSNLNIPNDYEIFASGDVEDIVEPYDEEGEKRWREQHREKVRQYRKQLASKKENEDDFFKKLDKLEEEEEEEEKEENKNEDEEEDGDDDDDDSYFDDEDIDEEEYDKLIEECIKLNEIIPEPSTSSANTDLEDVGPPAKALLKRVSFSDSLESTLEFSTSYDDDISIIHFRHSQVLPKNTQNVRSEENLNTPSDIYKKYLLDVDNIVRKSILKKDNYGTQSDVVTPSDKFSNTVIFPETNASLHYNLENVQKSKLKMQQTSTDADTGLSLNEMSIDEVFGDIVEKTPSVVSKTEHNPRRVSKFKQSRMK